MPQDFTNWKVRAETVNGVKKYDTLGQIALAWLEANPDAEAIDFLANGEHPERIEKLNRGHHNVNQHNLDIVMRWIKEANHLKDASGKECDGPRFKYAIVPAHHVITMPPGHDIQPPKMHTERTCEVILPPPVKMNQPTPPAPEAPIPPAPPPPPPLQAAPPPPPIERRRPPVEFFTQAQGGSGAVKGADGKTRWQMGSDFHAYQAYSDSGVDPEFTKYWNKILSITPRIAEHGEQYTGQTGPFDLEGNYSGKNRQSRKDDKDAKRTDLNGNRGILDTVGLGDGEVGRSFIGGFTKVDPKTGDYIRDDHDHTVPFAFGDTAFTVNLPFGHKLIVPFVPIAAAGVMNPAKESKGAAVTDRGGLTEVNVSLAALNFAGKNTVFADEQAQKTNRLAPAEDIYAKMFLKNAQNKFQDDVAHVAGLQGDAQKTAAVEALVALRDYGDNKLVRRVDSMAQPLENTRNAVLDYFAAQGLNREEIAAAAHDAPRLQMHMMSKEQKAALFGKDADKKDGGARFGGIVPNGETAMYDRISKNYVYPTMNSFEAKIATGVVANTSEQDMIQQSHDAWKAITANPQAADVFIRLIRDGDGNPLDHNAQLSIGEGLRSMIKNPHNYFTDDKQKDAQGKKRSAEEKATEFVKQFFPHTPDGKLTPEGQAAANEITRNGASGPIWFVTKDKPFPLEHPETFGPVIGGELARKPELFKAYIDHVTDPRFNADGRRDGIGMLGALARHRDQDAPGNGRPQDFKRDGFQTWAYRDFKASFDPSTAKALRDTLETGITYSETITRDHSLQGIQKLDNQLTNEQHDFKDGKTSTPSEVYHREFLTPEMKDSGANQVAVAGLIAHPKLAGDAVLLTMLSNPEAFGPVKQRLKDYASTVEGHGEYGDLAKAMQKTLNEARKYQKNPNDPKAAKALDEAVKDYGAYFRTMVANGHKNDGLQKQSAWEGLIEILGDDPKITDTILATASKNPRLVEASIKAVPATLAETERGRHENYGKRIKEQHVDEAYGKHNEHVGQVDTDDTGYESQFFDLPRDKHGKILNTDALGTAAKVLTFGIAGHTHHDVIVRSNAVKAAVLGVTAPDLITQNQAAGTDSQNVALDNFTPEQKAQLLALGVDVSKIAMADTLHMNKPIIVSAAASKSPQAETEAVVDWVMSQNKNRTFTQEDKAGLLETAGALLQKNPKTGKALLEVSVNGQGLLEVLPDSQGLENTLLTGEVSGESRGFDKAWLLAIIIPFLPKGVNPPSSPPPVCIPGPNRPCGVSF